MRSEGRKGEYNRASMWLVWLVWSVCSMALVSGLMNSEAPPDKPLVNNEYYSWFCVGNCENIAQTIVSPTYGMVLMGGGTDVDAAYIWMIEKMGGGDFVVLRTSGDGAYDQYIYDLSLQTSTPLNSVSTLLLKNREASFQSFVVELVQNCSGVYFAGGDQWEYYSFWKGTPLHSAILQSPIYPTRPIGGTSAGLAIQPQNVYVAQFGSAGSVESLYDPYNQYVQFGTNFLQNGYLVNTVTDSHFYQRDRMGRLVAFISRAANDILSPLPDAATGCGGNYGSRGIGIDEATALLVDENGIASLTTWDTNGSAYLLCLDVLPSSCEPATPLDVSDIATVRLTGNLTNVFDLSSWAPTASGSSSVTQYLLSASNSRLSATGNGGNIY